jgi:phosphate transport system permease protein
LIEGITRLSLGKLILKIRIGKSDGSRGSIKLFLLRFCMKCFGFIIALIGAIISVDAVIVTGYIVNIFIFIGFLWSSGSYKTSIYDLIVGSAIFKLTEIEVRLAKNNIFKVCILVIGSIIIIPLIAIILFITYQGGSAIINWLSPLLFVKIIILLCSIVGIILANKLVKSKKIRIIVSLISSITLIIMFLMIIDWDFITTAKQLRDYGGGGIAHSLIGTIILIVIAVIVSVPLGIGAGIFLAEKPKSKIASIVRTTVELFQGVPSVIIGLVGYLWLVLVMGKPTAIAGGITLSLMMFPLIIRSTEETLKLVPASLKEASLALGVPYYKTVLKVMLPTGMSGIVTGILLGIGRIAGETAPLLFTIFGNPSISANLFQPIDALPLLIYNYATGPAKELHSIAWGASFVLMVFILLLNVLTRLAIRKK